MPRGLVRQPYRRFVLPALACILLSWAACSTPRPAGISDAAADALARKMLASVDAEAWQRTGALTWTLGNRHHHLWDRRRQVARVKTGDTQVFLRLGTQTGVAFEDGVRLEGKKLEKALKKAYAAWANDSFWLVANNKAFDPGTKRYRVSQEDGGEALLVEYSSGGVTPGDAYLWHLDDNGRPVSWQMWVSFLPVGGVSATWEGWVQLRTGLWVSTRHDAGPITISIGDLDGAETLGELVDGPDPFSILFDE